LTETPGIALADEGPIRVASCQAALLGLVVRPVSSRASIFTKASKTTSLTGTKAPKIAKQFRSYHGSLIVSGVLHSLVHVFPVGPYIVFELLIFSQQELYFLLESLYTLNSVVLLVEDVALLVVPLSSFFLKVKE